MRRELEAGSGGDLWRLPPWEVRTVVSNVKQPFLAWGVELLGVPKIWTDSRGRGVKVAVLDTGCDLEHPDFAGAIIAQRDFTKSAWGVSDRQGHGTHTAGTIGARNNGRGTVGVAPECDLIIAKCLGDDGTGWPQWIADALRWAAFENGADVISMSLGAPGPSPEIEQALQEVVRAGKLVVVAAGNEGPGRNTVGYPAAWSTLALAVGAVDKRKQVAPFSSRGPQVDVMAPGVAVPSCWPGGDYAYLDGTSMATPFVAGVVALALSDAREGGAIPFKDQSELEAALRASAVPLGADEDGHSEDWGFGLVNPGSFVDDASPDVPPPSPAPGVVRLFKTEPFLGYVWELTATPV